MAPITLLDLPHTIVEDIVALALGLSSPSADYTKKPKDWVYVRTPGTWDYTKKPKEKTFPGILLVSRRLSNMALWLLYSRNTFECNKLVDVVPFLDRIGSRNVGNIRHMKTTRCFNRDGDVDFVEMYGDILCRLSHRLRSLALELPDVESAALGGYGTPPPPGYCSPTLHLSGRTFHRRGMGAPARHANVSPAPRCTRYSVPISQIAYTGEVFNIKF